MFDVVNGAINMSLLRSEGINFIPPPLSFILHPSSLPFDESHQFQFPYNSPTSQNTFIAPLVLINLSNSSR